MRYANRRDENEPGIVEALHKVGAQVFHLNDEIADLAVRFRNQWFLIEVKGERGKLTFRQSTARSVVGNDALPVVKTIDEALKVLGQRAPLARQRTP
jgi:hypothetical protein